MGFEFLTVLAGLGLVGLALVGLDSVFSKRSPSERHPLLLPLALGLGGTGLCAAAIIWAGNVGFFNCCGQETTGGISDTDKAWNSWLGFPGSLALFLTGCLAFGWREPWARQILRWTSGLAFVLAVGWVIWLVG
jgi:hypothetical protein